MKGKSFPCRESNLVAETAVSPYKVYAGLLTEYSRTILISLRLLKHIFIKQAFCR